LFFFVSTIKDLLHSLVNDGVASCLTDDEVSPLNNDNRHEERRVTSVLQSLALRVRLTHVIPYAS